MSTKKTEMKVSINCQKCKTEVLKVVAKLQGVDEVKVDGEKGIVTVLGSCDPVCVASKIRKAGYHAEITSVGPPKKPQPSPEKDIMPPLPACCDRCQLVGVSYVTYDHTPVCSIL